MVGDAGKREFESKPDSVPNRLTSWTNSTKVRKKVFQK
jgi:hypothetical protein